MKRPDKEIGKVLHGIKSYPQRYQETILEYITYLESQLQPHKTVGDAVEYYKGVWSLGELDILFWSETYECYGDYSLKAEGAYKVCTREEFGAEVERRRISEITDVDSLTHVAPNGESCRVLYEDDRSQLIEYQDGTRACYFVKSHYATKRKPSISKAEAWSKLMAEHENPKGRSIFSTFYEILEQFEVK